MPTGVILTSASPGATEESVSKVLEAHGLLIDKPESDEREVPEAEPERDGFETEDEFKLAHEEWQAKQPPEEEAEEDEELEEVRRKRPSKFQKRIDKITARLRQENADLMKRIEAIEKGGKKEDETADPNPRPVRTAFASQEEYEDALLAWGTERAISEKAAKEAEQSEKQQLEETWTSYKANVEAFKEEHDDWDEVVNQDIPMHTGVQLAIMEQENGAEVVYYLGTHPEYAKKLAEMKPLSAVMEVGRLSAKLTAASGSGGTAAGRGANPKPKPKAPAPVQPVSTAATSSSLTSQAAAKAGNFKAFKAAQRAGR
jgi:hypothetical protein